MEESWCIVRSKVMNVPVRPGNKKNNHNTKKKEKKEGRNNKKEEEENVSIGTILSTALISMFLFPEMFRVVWYTRVLTNTRTAVYN